MEKEITQQTEKKNILQILTHILIWGIIFGLPFLMFWKNENVNLLSIFQRHGISILSSMIVFYVNYFFLIDQYLFKKKIWSFIISNLLLIFSVTLLVYFWAHFIVEPPPGVAHHMPKSILSRNILFFARESFSLTLIAAISVTIKLLSKWFTTETERQEEKQRRKEAELINLRQQINPHFLFNTLNNIYALIEISPEKAQNAVLELSKLLRYVLYENNDNFVPLHQELDFIRNYVELMRIRLTPNVEMKIEIEPAGEAGQTIAPMLFIALIENAFKHGVSPTKPSFIDINIYQNDNRLICLVSNSYFPKDETDRSGSGIGMENLQRRLDILYPHQHIFRTEEKNNIFTAELIVPLKNQ